MTTDPRIVAALANVGMGDDPRPEYVAEVRDHLAVLDAADAAAGWVRVDTRNPDPEQLRAIYLACFDPGRFTARGDNYKESLDMWRARAVLAALAPAEDTP